MIPEKRKCEKEIKENDDTRKRRFALFGNEIFDQQGILRENMSKYEISQFSHVAGSEKGGARCTALK